MPNHLATLTERRDYLSGRAALKAGLGWEFEYDERERDALTWAIRKLRGEEQDVSLPSDTENPYFQEQH